ESPFAQPYLLDLLALYLWRTVGSDVADAAARNRHASAAHLSEDVRRYLGIGNSSGIGMVAALVRWPVWLSTYCTMREVSRAYAVTRPRVDTITFDRFIALVSRTADYYDLQPAQAVTEVEQPVEIAAGLRILRDAILRDRDDLLVMDFPWYEVARRA